jgi:histidine ammonia-lyase
VPASVFSRSTECHNQDKVSMGTIAARDLVRVNELVTQVLAASLLAAFQALHLRLKSGELKAADLGQTERTYAETAAFFRPLADDRPLDEDLRTAVELIQAGRFSLE